MAAAMETRLDWFAQRVASSPIPVIPVSSTCVDLAGDAREQLASLGTLPAARPERLDHRDRQRAALGGEPRFSLGRRGRRGGTAGHGEARHRRRGRGRRRGAALLTAAGVPVVPGGLALLACEAAELAARVGLPVALKICSAQITHKSDIGGVALGLRTEAEVRAGYEKVRAAGARAIR